GAAWLRTANARLGNGDQGADTRRGWRAVGAAWLRTANARRVIVGRGWSADSRLHQDSRQLPTTHADVVRPLQPGFDSRCAVEGFGDRHACRDRESSQVRNGNPGTGWDAGEEQSRG